MLIFSLHVPQIPNKEVKRKNAFSSTAMIQSWYLKSFAHYFNRLRVNGLLSLHLLLLFLSSEYFDLPPNLLYCKELEELKIMLAVPFCRSLFSANSALHFWNSGGSQKHCPADFASLLNLYSLSLPFIPFLAFADQYFSLHSLQYLDFGFSSVLKNFFRLSIYSRRCATICRRYRHNVWLNCHGDFLLCVSSMTILDPFQFLIHSCFQQMNGVLNWSPWSLLIPGKINLYLLEPKQIPEKLRDCFSSCLPYLYLGFLASLPIYLALGFSVKQ